MPIFFKQILAAVGRNGTNSIGDRRIVMHLLNQVPDADGGPVTFFIESDPVSELIVAIERFQRQNIGFADGRIDVDGKTFRALREFDADPAGPVLLPTTRSGKKSGRKKVSTPTVKRIFASVGRSGINSLGDRRVVMHLLNQVPDADGGPVTFFIESNSVSELIVAIERFQGQNSGFTDGRVNVEGKTLRLLRDFDADPAGPIFLPTTRSGKKGGRKRVGP